MNAPHHHFGLCLVVNHACNLRCDYCYTGTKFSSAMPWETGVAAISRAFSSLLPAGQLELGFFGGEPLLECARIEKWMDYSRTAAHQAGKRVRFNLTTNGTITHREAWDVLCAEDLDLAVSFDGNPAIHNRHRRDTQGNGSASRVEETLRRLTGSRKLFRVVMVVRPDNLAEVPDGLEHLRVMGIQAVDLSLDLWTAWTVGDGARLQNLVHTAARLWRDWLPEFSLNWFDSKVAQLAQLPKSQETTRCGFGNGEIAVAPSGRLYPCERLVGEDRPGHPMCLPGHVLEGSDFSDYGPTVFDRCAPCSRCLLASSCDTTCRCSNFVRTGNPERPDGLLCLLNKATAEAVTRVLEVGTSNESPTNNRIQNERLCHVQ